MKVFCALTASLDSDAKNDFYLAWSSWSKKLLIKTFEGRVRKVLVKKYDFEIWFFSLKSAFSGFLWVSISDRRNLDFLIYHSLLNKIKLLIESLLEEVKPAGSEKLEVEHRNVSKVTVLSAVFRLSRCTWRV